MTFWERIERVGYLRAASLMDREGYPDLARQMRETAARLSETAT
jgi:uncharacterized protein (DUF952 family)